MPNTPSRWASMQTHRSILALTLLGVWMLSLIGCAQTPNFILHQRARTAMASGNLQAAEANLGQALSQQPGDWKANYLLALVRLQQNRPLDAQLLAEHAMTQNPDGQTSPYILDALAEALLQQNQPVALTSFLKQTASERQTPYDFLRAGKFLAKLGDKDGSELAFRKAARIARADDPTPYVFMADFYESINDAQRAQIALRRAHYVVPNDYNINQRLRGYGLIPGPTIALPPEE